MTPFAPRDNRVPAPDPWHLYGLMQRSRQFETLIADLWHAGHIAGEMHLGTGEEGIMAGIVSQLRDGDALALDHRGTAALLMRGVDAWALLAECVGHPDGLGRGQGGHMHLFARDYLAASSGIVGAAGPAATGFALAGQRLRPGSIAVAFFGEGAMDQGMLLEAMNLAATWRLPVLFVCKDDGWAITTTTDDVRGSLRQRALGLGLRYIQATGFDVMAVWPAAQAALAELRHGGRPIFLHARCVHPEGHFLGFQLLRLIRRPVWELPRVIIPLLRALFSRHGGSVGQRLAGLRVVVTALLATWRDPRQRADHDPIVQMRQRLRLVDEERLTAVDTALRQEMSQLKARALAELPL